MITQWSKYRSYFNVSTKLASLKFVPGVSNQFKTQGEMFHIIPYYYESGKNKEDWMWIFTKCSLCVILSCIQYAGIKPSCMCLHNTKKVTFKIDSLDWTKLLWRGEGQGYEKAIQLGSCYFSSLFERWVDTEKLRQTGKSTFFLLVHSENGNRLRLGHPKIRSQKLHLCLPCGWQAPNFSSHLLLSQLHEKDIG